MSCISVMVACIIAEVSFNHESSESQKCTATPRDLFDSPELIAIIVILISLRNLAYMIA